MTRTLATALRLGRATLRLNPLRTSLSTLGISWAPPLWRRCWRLATAEAFALSASNAKGLQAIRLASRTHDEVDGQRVPRSHRG